VFAYREQEKVEGGKRIFPLSLLLEIIFRGNTLGRNALLEFSTTIISLSRIARAAEMMKVVWLLACVCLTAGWAHLRGVQCGTGGKSEWLCATR